MAVDVAVNGTDAIWHGGEFAYSAVILDVMLPEIDGFEVCRRLRAADRWAPVLVLTARDAVDDRIRGLDVGADDYLTDWGWPSSRRSCTPMTAVYGPATGPVAERSSPSSYPPGRSGVNTQLAHIVGT